VTTKDKVDRLIHLVNRIVEDGETELNEEALLDRFNAM
jgi:hypothetical protein